MVYIKDPEKKAKYYKALENEKNVLQKLINEMGIDETIKQMKFEFSKAYCCRTVTLIFKSKYTSVHGDKMNRWISVDMLWRGEHDLKTTNMISWNGITMGGVIYKKEYWEEGRKIGLLLRNRYWVWIRQIDRLIERDKEYHEKYFANNPELIDIYRTMDYATELDKTYQAAKYACNEITIPIREAINLYNEQVESGLIYDSTYGKINYPEDHILEEHPIEDFQCINNEGFYLHGYKHRVLG